MSENSNTPANRRAASGPKFDVRTTEDFMAIVLSCTVPPRTPEILVARIRNEMADLGVESDAQLDEAIARYKAAIPSGPHLEDIILLEGVPPTSPIDESIKWNGNFHAKGFVVDPHTGKADYRRKLADVSVAQDQLLAEIIPAVPGESGKDVFGRMVPPRAPRPAKIREGKNVRFEPTERCFYAETAGRIRYVGGVLFVDDVFRVAGDVGLRTGNINHPGALVVSRDILSGAEVIALGDIDVGENIEDATVESGGNITVHGGISCKERCLIKVAGDLHARYIRNVDIEAGGDIFIEREINQCNIKARGAVSVRNGRIVGGSILALRGIETGDLGSDACIPATLTVGKDFTMENTLAEKRATLESSRQLVLKLRDAVAPLRAKKHALTPALKQRLVQLLDELSKREAEFQTVDRELNDIFRDTHAAAKYRILVHGKIYPDNMVQVGAQSKKIKDGVPGPVRVGLKQGKLAFFRMKENESL